MSNSDEEIDDYRKRFYEYLDRENGLPDSWEIMNSTVYSDVPSFRTIKSDNEQIMLRVSIEQTGECSIISTRMIADSNGFEYKMGHRWEVDNPMSAARCLIEESIPKAEEEFGF